MTAILILLGVFSLTILISHQGFLKKINAFSFVSIPIIIGFAFSQDGFIQILPSTRESLSLALRVGLTWVTFLTGMRLAQLSPSWQQTKNLIPMFLTYILFFILTYLTLQWAMQTSTISHSLTTSPSASLLPLLALSLALSALLFSSKENPFVLVLVALASSQFIGSSGFRFDFTDLVFPLFIGLLLALSCRLIIDPKQSLSTSSRLALGGISTLGAGWAMALGYLEVLVGLSFGWAMALIHKENVIKDPKLLESETSIRFVVPLFAGLYLELLFPAIIVGASLALLRLLLKWFIIRSGLRSASLSELLVRLLPLSSLALPIVMSLHLSPVSGAETLFILVAFCVGFIVNDLVALLVELWKKNSLATK